MNSKVSIVIPCFNDGKYLPEAVASARAQTYPDIEIIVVDDHSTDESTKVAIKALQNEGVLSLLTPEGKKGLPAARNTGIAVASGEYILPLDADDTIYPSYVEKAVAILDTKPGVGICYCKANLFGLKRGPWNLPPYSHEEMLAGNVIFATALFRKTDWELVGGYDESLVYGFEDYAFWLHLITLGREVVRLEEELFSYRIKPNSMIASMAAGERHIHAIDDVFRSCESIFSQNALPLLKKVHSLQEEKSQLTCLVSWKFFAPAMRFEWFLRQKVKKILGRA